MNMRDRLIDAFLEYRNNFLTIEKYAEMNGLTLRQATFLLVVAQQVFESQHPEA